MSDNGTGKGNNYRRDVGRNRRAYHEYLIHEKVEAGLVLTGTEVKAARSGKVQLRDGFVLFHHGEAFLHDVHIGAYSHGNRENHEPMRPRKLLLSRREIDHLAVRSEPKGWAVVPLAMYIKGRTIKVELGLGQGKKLHDKRAAEREKELDREARDAMKTARRWSD
jgi:SsrA-binding protein